MATATTGFQLLDIFRPEVNQYCTGAPAILIRNHILKSIINFCERTQVLKKDPSTFYLDEDEYLYSLKYSGNRYRVVTVDACTLGTGEDAKELLLTTENEMDHSRRGWRDHESTEPRKYMLTDNTNQIRIYPTPNQDSEDEIYIRSVVVPMRDQTEVDEFLYEKWFEEIQAGALASLLAIQNSSWFNMQLSGVFSGIYRKGIRKARATTLKGTGKYSGRVMPQSYIIGR